MYNLLDAQLTPVAHVLIVVGIMLVIALVFGFLIMVVSKKFAVDVDEREETVLGCLAGANCGGCGKAGCAALAHSLVEGKGEIDDCPVTDKKNKLKIAEILGVDYAGGGEFIYVVNCGGGINAKDRNDYLGESGCVRQSMVSGGRKFCSTACLGDGSCVSVCDNDAVSVIDGVAYIDTDKCIKCGKCARTCPKTLITKIPASAVVYVKCSTKCRGKEVMDACAKGCIGCGICAKNCAQKAITMVDNLPRVDYSKCVGCGYCVEKCPRKVFHFVDRTRDENRDKKG